MARERPILYFRVDVITGNNASFKKGNHYLFPEATDKIFIIGCMSET